MGVSKIYHGVEASAAITRGSWPMGISRIQYISINSKWPMGFSGIKHICIDSIWPMGVSAAHTDIGAMGIVELGQQQQQLR